jgi:hypothetical protein
MISILYVIIAGLFFFSPVLVVKIMKGDWQEVLDYVLLYGWTGVGWISAWCLLLEIRLENKV